MHREGDGPQQGKEASGMTRDHCLSFECDELLHDKDGRGLKQIRDPRSNVISSAGKNTQEGEMRMNTSISNEKKNTWSLTVGVNASGIPLLPEAGLEISVEKLVSAWRQGHLITKTFYDEAREQYDHRVHISDTMFIKDGWKLGYHIVSIDDLTAFVKSTSTSDSLAKSFSRYQPVGTDAWETR